MSSSSLGTPPPADVSRPYTPITAFHGNSPFKQFFEACRDFLDAGWLLLVIDFSMQNPSRIAQLTVFFLSVSITLTTLHKLSNAVCLVSLYEVKQQHNTVRRFPADAHAHKCGVITAPRQQPPHNTPRLRMSCGSRDEVRRTMTFNFEYTRPASTHDYSHFL